MHRCFALALTLLALGGFAGPGHAGDGRIEINQTCALAPDGCGPGDAQGFPVTLAAVGGYVLTSDLVPGVDNVAIEIRQNSIDLDLNGFSLRGPAILGGPASGIVSFNLFASNARIHGGAVRGFQGKGIDLPGIDGVRLDELLVTGNDLGGIVLGEHGLVTNTRVLSNGQFGMSLGSTTGYQSCIVQDTSQGSAVVGGVQLAGSSCDDETCTAYPPLRRFYLTQGASTGGQALEACAAGFHMASLWEIWDPSHLRYDTTRGRAGADSGLGPPSSPGASGWIRGIGLGLVDCSSWTSSSPISIGTIASLNLSDEPDENPWFTSSLACGTSIGIWCVED